MQVKISSKGSFKNTYKFLKFLSDWKIEQSLKKYAQKGGTLREGLRQSGVRVP